MKNYHHFLFDIPRQLRFPARLYDCGYHGEATGGGHGKRDNTLEIGIRLRSENNIAVDFIDDKKYETPFPHVILKTPGMVYYSKFSDPREIFYLTYPESSIPFLLENGFTFSSHFLPLSAPEFVLECASKIEILSTNLLEKGVVDQIDLLAFQLAHSIFLAKKNSEEKPDFYDEKILKIASCFRSRFRERIVLDELLREYGISRRTFFRYWKKLFTVTPKAYLNELRFQESMRLLTDTDEPVTSIAAGLGFPDVSYFSEHFKARFRKTPLQIRRSLL